MDLKALLDLPPWEWPGNTAAVLLDVLRSDSPAEDELLAAIELAGDFTVVDEKLVVELVAILESGARSEAARARAAISLGPVLEYMDMEQDGDGSESLPLTTDRFVWLQDRLHGLFVDTTTAAEIRRRVLEAAVRAPQEWQFAAIASAYASQDPAWHLTGAFCMRFIQGFEVQIVEALQDPDPGVVYQAVHAAGSWAVDAAWDRVCELATSRKKIDKALLLAAITAVGEIRPHEAATVLGGLLDSKDEDIREAVHDALAAAEPADDEEDWEDDEDDGGSGPTVH
jgi:HEAT repeats